MLNPLLTSFIFHKTRTPCNPIALLDFNDSGVTCELIMSPRKKPTDLINTKQKNNIHSEQLNTACSWMMDQACIFYLEIDFAATTEAKCLIKIL